MKIIKVLGKTFLFLLLLTNLVWGQTIVNDSSVEDGAKLRAREIIAKSRNYTNKKINIENIKSLTRHSIRSY